MPEVGVLNFCKKTGQYADTIILSDSVWELGPMKSLKGGLLKFDKLQKNFK